MYTRETPKIQKTQELKEVWTEYQLVAAIQS